MNSSRADLEACLAETFMPEFTKAPPTGCNHPVNTFCLDSTVFLFNIELVANVKTLGDFT